MQRYEQLSIMTRGHDTLVLANRLLSQGHSSHSEANISQPYETFYGCLE
jgi:hypothetical protein